METKNSIKFTSAMNDDMLNQFTQELRVTYRNECYLVRDNGSVCRQPKDGSRRRQFDGIWTYGRKGAGGYKHLGQHYVHQVIATAFKGEAPSKYHVVDHIDTNRENNNPKNLHWVTQEENLFNNPITLNRIQSIWGSVESMLNYFKKVSPNINSESLTPMAMQRHWKTPCEFSACPTISEQMLSENFISNEDAYKLLEEYLQELEFGSEFSRNIYGESYVVKADLITTKNDGIIPTLFVLCNTPNNEVKKWAVAQVIIENVKFVHENKSSYFTLQGALKAYCQLAGIKFADSIDDSL
jgi:hypothetical protein